MNYKHGDTATCGNCGEMITRKLDRANPYWEHANRYPYCHDARGLLGKADPKKVLV